MHYTTTLDRFSYYLQCIQVFCDDSTFDDFLMFLWLSKGDVCEDAVLRVMENN